MNLEYTSEPDFISNSNLRKTNVKREIQDSLLTCESFQISVAFITSGGLGLLREQLKKLKCENIKGRIITSTYLLFNKPDVFYDLLSYPNIDVRIYEDNNSGFHPKGYFFNKENYSSVLIGSANLTGPALVSNQEWNIKLDSLHESQLYKKLNDEFEMQWNSSSPLTLEWIKKYESVYNSNQISIDKSKSIDNNGLSEIIQPNEMQKSALGSLQAIRAEGKQRALLISATGTGKTYLSAFDVLECRPERMLFIVHREKIASSAMQSFSKIIKDRTVGLYTGNDKDFHADYIFATVQTLSKDKNLKKFKKDLFDYIVIDEVHRAGSNTFQNVLDYFKPKFLLGMTATPDRNDGYNIYELFDHTIAYEIRLKDALKYDYLCPFYYYGIHDIQIAGKKQSYADFNFVEHEQRVEHIINQIKEYKFSGDKVRGLVFCSRTKEAQIMCDSFNQRGYRSVVLTGSSSEEERESAIQRLELKECEQSLDYIFTVDIFNEGIDIPSLNQILMVRETKSPIVFIQQLGRGLRKHHSKEYVVILDFIGNYNNNYMIAVALSGNNSYSKDDMRRFVTESDFMLPGFSNISFDEVSKEMIFSSIDKAKISYKKFLEDQYINLKNKLNRIPSIFDYEKHDSISIIYILSSKYGGSYHNFLKNIDSDYDSVFSLREEQTLEFLTSKFIKGKRIHEVLLLSLLIENGNVSKSYFKNTLFSRFKLVLTDSEWESIVRVLDKSFYTKQILQKFKDVKLIDTKKQGLEIAQEFKHDLENRNFYQQVNDILIFAFDQYKEIYANDAVDDRFVPYEKYSYEDVCRILNWSSDCTATVGGYKFDKSTNTLPVFINYNKDDDISELTKYEDHFINPKKLVAISKRDRKIENMEMQRIINSEKTSTKIYLFVRKNKDDSTSKEFYYMGKMSYESMTQAKMQDGKTNICEITYILENPIRNDLYDYITSS